MVIDFDTNPQLEVQITIHDGIVKVMNCLYSFIVHHKYDEYRLMSKFDAVIRVILVDFHFLHTRVLIPGLVSTLNKLMIRRRWEIIKTDRAT